MKARYLFLRIRCGLAFLLGCACPICRAQETDLLLVNGNIYTVSEAQPRAEAVAAHEGKIVFVGSNEDAKRLRSEHTRLVDLHGQTVVPGLTDSHCHIFEIGERELNLNLEGTNSLEDFLEKVKAYVAQSRPGAWVTGRGWIETFWKSPRFPTRQDLDKIAPRNPLFLTRADGHTAVANSDALKWAEIDKHTPNPFGGEILKDQETGEPNGMLLDNARDLVAKHIPRPRVADQEKAFLLAVKREIELGWCEIQNAGSNANEIAGMRRCLEAGEVKLRIYNAVYGPGKDAQARKSVV